MARDVQDAQVPKSPWMGESGPDRIHLRLRRCLVNCCRNWSNLWPLPSECTPVFAISLLANKVKIQF
jgi:hypothetical protein